MWSLFWFLILTVEVYESELFYRLSDVCLLNSINCCWQEAEHAQSLRQMEEDMARKLSEQEQEMRLAMEERDLQKMATLSQQDSLRDHLQTQVDTLSAVSI